MNAGNVTCSAYPLEYLDTIHSETGEMQKKSALNLIGEKYRKNICFLIKAKNSVWSIILPKISNWLTVYVMSTNLNVPNYVCMHVILNSVTKLSSIEKFQSLIRILSESLIVQSLKRVFVPDMNRFTSLLLLHCLQSYTATLFIYVCVTFAAWWDVVHRK